MSIEIVKKVTRQVSDQALDKDLIDAHGHGSLRASENLKIQFNVSQITDDLGYHVDVFLGKPDGTLLGVEDKDIAETLINLFGGLDQIHKEALNQGH